jgi:hypothetical protein
MRALETRPPPVGTAFFSRLAEGACESIVVAAGLSAALP